MIIYCISETDINILMTRLFYHNNFYDTLSHKIKIYFKYMWLCFYFPYFEQPPKIYDLMYVLFVT